MGSEPFLVINGDILIDFDCRTAIERAIQMSARTLAHLWLVPNPPHHPQGDFRLQPGGQVTDAESQEPAHTFSGIGLYRPELFARTAAHQRANRAPLLRQALRQGQVCGDIHPGRWLDVGTPERLQEAARISGQWAG